MANERILVVDDEESIRDVVSSILKQAGFDCRSVSSGAEAMSALRADSGYVLVLSDLIMDGMDGLALLQRIKKSQPRLNVVMVTAVHDISVALEAIRHGAYDYLLKPFEREQLLAIVARAVENYRLKMENVSYQTKLETLVGEQTQALRHAFGELERSYDITLEALGNALDLKDAETEGHSKRVTAFTIAIARAMGLAQDRIRVIARGAFLHDIGKMAIPDAILRKPGRLTPEEQTRMREHARLGYQMLRRIPYLQEASNIVYSHQERYDGSGYPRGLKGEQIPLGARIFAIADTFDAITSDRPYRAAQSISSARREIQRYSGSQFDPELVDVFISVSEEIWQKLRDEIDSQSERQRYKINRASHFSPVDPVPFPAKASSKNGILSESELEDALQNLPGWKKNGNVIQRAFEFSDFALAMDFVNQIAGAAEAANHHPDIIINYNKVMLTLVSHDAGGITQRDVRMAGKINEVSGA